LGITVHFTLSGKHNQNGDRVKKITVENEVGKRIKSKTNSTNKNILITFISRPNALDFTKIVS